MKSKFVKGITAGAIIGTAVGMFVIPNLDRGTKRKLKRTSKVIKCMTDGICNNVIKMTK